MKIYVIGSFILFPLSVQPLYMYLKSVLYDVFRTKISQTRAFTPNFMESQSDRDFCEACFSTYDTNCTVQIIKYVEQCAASPGGILYEMMCCILRFTRFSRSFLHFLRVVALLWFCKTSTTPINLSVSNNYSCKIFLYCNITTFCITRSLSQRL